MKDLDNINLINYKPKRWSTTFILWENTDEGINIIGVMETNSHDIGWEVFRVAAEDGYGPWLYIMALSTHDRLSPNQDGIEDVSSEASAVWEYFYNQGIDSEEISESIHEDEWLRRVYIYDYNLAYYEDTLEEATHRGSNISDEEFDIVKQKAEEYLDDKLEKLYDRLQRRS